MAPQDRTEDRQVMLNWIQDDHSLALRNSNFAMVPKCTSSGPSAILNVLAVAHRCARTVSPDSPAAPCTCIAMSTTFSAISGAATYINTPSISYFTYHNMLSTPPKYNTTFAIAMHSILVASEDATCGSVIAKPDRIFPSSKGISHSLICSAFPYRSAPQLKTCGAQIERPIISQRYPYSRLESPAPNKQSYLLFDVVSLLSPKRSFLARAALSNCTST
nr:hypothetical protein Iba_chr09aCG2040 [Ipomoea batatas]